MAVAAVDGARRGRPIKAPATSTQAASSSRTANGTKGNCERESAAVPLAPTVYCAAQPKAGRRATVCPSSVSAKLPAGAYPA